MTMMTLDSTPPVPVVRTATTIIFFANGLGIGAWAAAIPVIADRLALAPDSLAASLFAFAAGAVLAMPATGVLAHRWGSGRLTWTAGAGFALALGLPSLANGMTILAITAFILGFACGGLDVAMNAHAASIERRMGRPVMSSFHAAFSFGGLAGSALGGTLALIEPQNILWIPAVTSAILVIGFSPDLGPGKPVQGAAPPPPSAKCDWGALASLAAIALVCMMIEGAMADWSGVYLAATDPRLGAVGYGAFSVAMATGRLFGDQMVKMLGAHRVVGWGGFAAAVGLACASAFPGGVAVFGFALVGLSLANVVPAVFSAAARTSPTPAQGVAFVASAGYAGFLAGPPMIGAIATFASLRLAILALALAGLIIPRLGRRRDRQPSA